MNLPDLGVGLVYLPGLEGLTRTLGGALDLVEVEPQTFWTLAPDEVAGFRVDRAALARGAALGKPALVHSIGFPVGGARDGDARHRAALRESFALLDPPWWSEHMSFLAAADSGGTRHLGFLMPPVQSRQAVATIADRIRRLQDDFGLPFAFETGVNYLRPIAGEMADGDFWAEIAERADCGILLDLHNVWANQVNGRQALPDLFGRLPLERVWELHVAGGQWHKGYWLDSHSGLPPDPVIAAARDLVPRLPALHAILLEIIPDQIEARAIGEEEIASCLSALRAIWAQRGTIASATKAVRPPAPADDGLPAPADWELALEAALAQEAEDDPGFEIYRDLIAMARRGTLVEALPLSLRYLRDSLGRDGLEGVFRRFWRGAAPEPFMSEEARGFAAFASAELALPHLGELLAFELAAHRAAITGTAQYVDFTCRPEPLIAALKAGEPPVFVAAAAEVEITPPLRG